MTRWLAGLIFLAAISAHGQSFSSEADKGHVEFLAIGKPAMIRVKGQSPGPVGTVEIGQDKNVSGEFTLELKNLSTGIDLRDKHMREKYLQVDKFPQAKIIIKAQPVPEGSDREKTFTAELFLHGLSKPVQGKYKTKDVATGQIAHAEFSLRLTDFGIDVPSYSGITVADEVQIKVDLELKIKAP